MIGPSFRLHVSNRLEHLAATFAREIVAAPGDPLAAERIVVPHPVLGRWLALELASRLGIAAHLEFALPAEFAWSLMRQTIDLPKAQPFAPAALRWRLFNALARWPHEDDLARYLADGDPRKRFALADRLAHVYDRCLLYRPEWIRAWESGGEPHWQARLWRLLAMPDQATHWVRAVDAFRQATDGGAAQLDLFEPATTVREGVAGRVSFFGVPSLSPSYLEMLRAAGREWDVHLYALSPCREFWADTRHRRELPTAAEDDPTRTEGNELLSAWGRAARDMQTLLAEDLGVGDPDEHYLSPDESSRLGQVQADILDLRLSNEAAPPASAKDDSLQVHVCHSATREAEVLHDRLLGLFDAHDDLQPSDVLVLTADMDEYAPAIEAVFEAYGAIPFNIGRLRRRDSAAVRAFLDLLALPGSRYAVSPVLAPLRAASVAAKFGINDGDLPEINAWIANAGIHWGTGETVWAGARPTSHGPPQHGTGASPGSADVPASEQHTWQEGLKRLLLGYALADAADSFAGVASSALDRFGNDGADRYERLGQFARYAELAIGLDSLAEEALTPADWLQCLRERVLGPFFATTHPLPEVAREADLVAHLIEELASEWRHVDTDGPIPFAVVRDALDELGAASSRAVARLADGVTVAPLAAGQVFPAKVVCAVGLNDRAFPRHRAPATFDLVAADVRRAGDRDVRDEDRLAILEALLGARRAFVVTYTGRDLREDAAIPPSVVVSELLDYLAARFPDDGPFAVKHPLQPFSPRYFRPGDPTLFSYSATMAEAANNAAAAAVRAISSGRAELAGSGGSAGSAESAGTAESLPPPARTASEITLAELIRFAANPVRHFATNRLGLRLEIDEEAPANDEEPLELDALQQWQLKADLVRLPPASGALVRARGRLPPGNLGTSEHRRAAMQVETLLQALDPHQAHLNAVPTTVDVDIGGYRILGQVDGFLPDSDTFLWWRIGRIRDKDCIDVWLRLLALTCTTAEPIAAHVVGVSDAPQRSFIQGPPPAAAQTMLLDWLAAWRRAWREPLPFFPETSLSWAREQNPQTARRTWHGARAESQDPYYQLLCPAGPDADDFSPLAERLLGPLVARWETP